jgi:hypothetical protein
MSTRLGRWLARENARQGRTVALEEALLARRTGRYAWYRLRLFLAGYLIESATHAVVAVVLLGTVGGPGATLVIGVHAAALLGAHAWWGVCEGLRTEVRERQRGGRAHRVPEVIAAWTTLSYVVAGVVLIGGAAWSLAQAVIGAFDVADALVAITALRVALEVLTRTLHSGVYATRRVYIPITATAAPQLLAAAVLLTGVPDALVVAALVTALLGPALQLRYTARVYAFAGIGLRRVARPVAPRVAWRQVRPSAGEALGGAVGHTATGLDAVVVLALLANGAQAVYLVLPTITAAAAWARLPYFDLKRLELRLFANLRRRFEHDTDRLAVLVGVVLGLVAAAVAAATGEPLPVAVALVAFLTARSFLACAQVQAFAVRAYGELAATGLCCAAGMAAVGATVQGAAARVVGVAVVAVATAAVLQMIASARTRRARPAALLTLEWLRVLGATRRPVEIGTARLAVPTGRAGADAARWQLDTLAGQLARRVGRTGAAAWLPPDRVVWAAARAPMINGGAPVGAAWLQETTGGLVDRVRVAEHADGEHALLAVARSGLLGRPGAALGRAVLPVDLAAARRSYRELVPTGVVLSPDEPVPASVRALSGRDLADVLADATDFARALDVPRRRAHTDVTSLCVGGELRLLFLGGSRRWHEHVRALNLRAAVAGAVGDPIGTGATGGLGGRST